MNCLLHTTIICAFTFTLLNSTHAESSKIPAIKPLRVALFADPGSTDAKSREAIYELLSGRDEFILEKVTTESVRAADFFNFHDVLILPGGTGSGEANAIGEEAGKRIAEHIKDGKGLIAICAGGYYIAQGGNAASAALDVISARNHDGENWARGEGFITVKVAGADDSASSRTMWFENGPLFKPVSITGLSGYMPLVQYVSDFAAEGAPAGQMTGRDAVIAATYGNGRVVAFGPHPELSPDVHHWLINAVKWTAGQSGQADQITADSVLEGNGPGTENSQKP